MKYFILLIVAIIGGILGFGVPEIPYAYYDYTAVAILATLDSLFGGMTSILKGKFDLRIFISGYFGNAIIAILLVALGEKLGVDIYLAAVIVFVQRMLTNFSITRRIIIQRKSNDKEVGKIEGEDESISTKS